MKPEEYRKMMDEHGYHGLQLVHMTLKEAKKFAGVYGMNAIVYNFVIKSMTLCRLENTSEGLVGIYNGGYGPRKVIIEPKIHDIYWIGGDDPRYDSYKEQR